MIATLTCLLLPFVGNCPEFVRNVPTIADVAQHRAAYNRKIVRVRGRVRSLDQWTSKAEGDTELFLICDGRCIRVYMRARSPIHEGEVVTVTGPYYDPYRIGRRAFYNEIEATEITAEE